MRRHSQHYIETFYLYVEYVVIRGRDSSVGEATSYWLGRPSMLVRLDIVMPSSEHTLKFTEKVIYSEKK
jgi:hypothetical protein